MKIKVKRIWLTLNSTISEVYVNDKMLCFGLEDAVREIEGQPVESWKIPKETAIPYGDYAVEITYSNRHKKDMIQIMDVPGFDGIRVDVANSPDEVEGCLAVGDKRDPDKPDLIFNSKNAYVKIFGAVQAALHRGEDVSISYVKG